MLIKRRPYNLLLVIGLLLVLLSLFVLNTTNTIDIHFHDTYFVLAYAHVFWLFGFIFLFLWTLYTLTKNVLFSKTLTWIHVIITVLTLIILALTFKLDNTVLISNSPTYNDANNWDSFVTYSRFHRTMTIVTIILLIGQTTFVINVFAGLLKRPT